MRRIEYKEITQDNTSIRRLGQDLPTKWRKMVETRREERISNHTSKRVRARESLEWREEKMRWRRWLKNKTEKGRGERERYKRRRCRPPENRKPVQPVSKPVQPVSGQTAQ
jgi:hypothetical protein